MNRKVIFSFALLLLVYTAVVFFPAEAAVVTSVTEITKEKIVHSKDVHHVDEIVDKLLSALNENDYEKFSNYYNPDMRGTISGNSKQRLSREAFAEMRAEMMRKGGDFISKRMVAGDGHGQMVRNDYIASFKNSDYVSRIGVIATNNIGERCVVDFWICWFDASEVDAANNITDDILAAIAQDKYDVFSEKISDALKLRYSKEEFRELTNNILSELGSYRGKENTFFNKVGNVLSVSSDLYYEKANKPIQFTIELEFLNGNTRVQNISFQWVPLTVRQQADILAEQSLFALVNENDYKKFIAYFDPKAQATFTKENYQSLRNSLLGKYGKYINKKLTGINSVKTYAIYNGATQLPIEIIVFQYALNFQNKKELNLDMVIAGNNGQQVIRNFSLNEPTQIRYLGNIADNN